MTLPIEVADPTNPGPPPEPPTPEVFDLDANAERIVSPEDTKGWRAARVDGTETFTTPEGDAYVRARTGEAADVIVSFTRTLGLTPMRLVASAESQTVKAAARKKRREERELRKRGYDV